ncbi:phage holin family protein [Methylobacterium sp. NEAU 140]|uniref:phage holin family protein n=1 Tax=Methylobacterium sp. NEAU 140 TaxID=3064945 RepID=UPI0027374C41|nr:phage holin family protein [Methylobacterium sp. NEAU 140]MDP4022936.1 phage holin family protein [Methylobacterium sp. NEAU 140]
MRDPDRAPPREAPIPDLLGAALRDGATHVEGLLTLARVETDANFRAIVRLVAILGAIPLIFVIVFFLGLDAVVKLLAVPFGSEAPAAALVALPFLAAALVLGRLGARRMALSNLEPWRTWRARGGAFAPVSRERP